MCGGGKRHSCRDVACPMKMWGVLQRCAGSCEDVRGVLQRCGGCCKDVGVLQKCGGSCEDVRGAAEV